MRYLDDIIDILNKHCVSYDYLTADVVCSQLKYLPDRNKIKTLNCLKKYFSGSVHNSVPLCNIITLLNDNDCLEFNPHLLYRPSGDVVLVLQYNRYLSLFKGKYFKTSHVIDGTIEFQIGTFSLDTFRHQSCNYFQHSELIGIAYYMNCISAAIGIKSFDTLLKNHPEVVDTFIKRSVSDYLPNYNITYNDLQEFIKESDIPFYEYVSATNSTVYRVGTSNH